MLVKENLVLKPKTSEEIKVAVDDIIKIAKGLDRYNAIEYIAKIAYNRDSNKDLDVSNTIIEFMSDVDFNEAIEFIIKNILIND